MRSTQAPRAVDGEEAGADPAATYLWWHGDGALGRVALDRALHCDRDYRLAQLLTLMLDEGIRPDRP